MSVKRGSKNSGSGFVFLESRESMVKDYDVSLQINLLYNF